MSSDMMANAEWEPMPWPPEMRACALPDAQWVVWTMIGAVVVAAALGMWVVGRMKGRQEYKRTRGQEEGMSS